MLTWLSQWGLRYTYYWSRLTEDTIDIKWNHSQDFLAMYHLVLHVTSALLAAMFCISLDLYCSSTFSLRIKSGIYKNCCGSTGSSSEVNGYWPKTEESNEKLKSWKI